MKNPLARIVLIISLLLAVAVPFAGLAPLTLFLVLWLVGSAFWGLLREAKLSPSGESLFPADTDSRDAGLKEAQKKSA